MVFKSVDHRKLWSICEINRNLCKGQRGDRAARGAWGCAPPENFAILMPCNVISSVLRGQFWPQVSANLLLDNSF